VERDKETAVMMTMVVMSDGCSVGWSSKTTGIPPRSGTW